jgi:hypothetical protein
MTVVVALRYFSVIASAAKQSISPLAEAWIASSLTLLAMTGMSCGFAEYPHKRDVTLPWRHAKSSGNRQRDPGLADFGHAHVKGDFSIQIDGD